MTSVAYSSPVVFGFMSTLTEPAWTEPLIVALDPLTSIAFWMSALFGIEAALSSTANQTVCGTHQVPAVKLSFAPLAVDTPPSTVVLTLITASTGASTRRVAVSWSTCCCARVPWKVTA